MTTDTEKFFETRQDAAFVKHTILGDYLVPYVTKAGSRLRRVVYVDGYAGPGVYEDETPGSPAIAVETAQKLKSIRQFRGHFIEQDRDFAAALQCFLRDQGVEDDWVVHHGSAKDCLPMALDDARRDPLLLFLDPYGLTVPFDQLVGEVMSRTEITEVVVNFSLVALQRLGGFLDQDYESRGASEGLLSIFGDEIEPEMTPRQVQRAIKQRDSILASLNAFLGGDRWQEVKRSGDPEWRQRVRDQYPPTRPVSGRRRGMDELDRARR